ncbi:MAG: sugar ABC transporter permease [Clostridia bacterium]|nr:sugar ABC transporter permease [Oscillospiraceae bacterium]MBS5432697.1 sugar ABC transporter permease [Bacillota bacterium]PWM15588.1 MAG: sugar ABC transporter permease [Clostridia bacterium]
MKSEKSRGRRLNERSFFSASPFLTASLIGFAIFYFVPMVISVVISLTDWNGLDRLLAPGFMAEHFIGLDNYKAILTGTEFWKVLKNTLVYIVLYIPLMLMVSTAIAALLSRQRRGVGVFRVLYYIPVLTSWVAASLIWKSLLSPQYGAMNGILAIFGIEGPGWLTDEKWAMPAIVLVSVWKDMGFFGLILLSGMVGIDRTYYEAAEIDGAGPWTRFLKITLPLLTPSLFYVLIVSLINSFQLFPQIMIMTDGGPNGATQVMVERIYKYGFRYFRMGYASAFSWILFIIIMICTAVQMRGQKRWVNYDT